MSQIRLPHSPKKLIMGASVAAGTQKAFLKECLVMLASTSLDKISTMWGTLRADIGGMRALVTSLWGYKIHHGRTHIGAPARFYNLTPGGLRESTP